MNLKVYGLVCVIIGCGGWGFLIACHYMQKIHLLRQFVRALDYMECELQYRSPSLPSLCYETAQNSSGKIKALFSNMAGELESQIAPNVECCMASALQKTGELPKMMIILCKSLGRSLGKFDLRGQLQGLDAIRQECRHKLAQLQQNYEARVRSYQTLGLCAGAALAILFV